VENVESIESVECGKYGQCGKYGKRDKYGYLLLALEVALVCRLPLL
jgi:hypothetical protein